LATRRIDQEVTQDHCGCEVADDSVVVKKFRPLADICSCNICISTIHGSQNLVTAWRTKPDRPQL